MLKYARVKRVNVRMPFRPRTSTEFGKKYATNVFTAFWISTCTHGPTLHTDYARTSTWAGPPGVEVWGRLCLIVQSLKTRDPRSPRRGSSGRSSEQNPLFFSVHFDDRVNLGHFLTCQVVGGSRRCWGGGDRGEGGEREGRGLYVQPGLHQRQGQGERRGQELWLGGQVHSKRGKQVK